MIKLPTCCHTQNLQYTIYIQTFGRSAAGQQIPHLRKVPITVPGQLANVPIFIWFGLDTARHQNLERRSCLGLSICPFVTLSLCTSVKPCSENVLDPCCWELGKAYCNSVVKVHSLMSIIITSLLFWLIKISSHSLYFVTNTLINLKQNIWKTFE